MRISDWSSDVCSSDLDRNDYRYRDRYRDPRNGYGYDYGRYGNGRSAVNRCVAAAERSASRYGLADVTQVTSIDRKRDAYKVKGRLVVRDGHGGRWGRGRSEQRRGGEERVHQFRTRGWASHYK